MIALGTIVISLTASILSAPVSASSTSSKQKTFNKIDNYITLNSNKEYELKSTASKNLTNSELTLSKEDIKKANKEIKKAKNNSNLSVSVKNNTILVKPTKNFVKTSLKKNGRTVTQIARSIDSLDTSAYWDYEICWWGQRIFLSRNFVNDMTQKVGTTTTYFAGGATALGVTQLMESLGMSSGPAGWIGLAFGGLVMQNYDLVVRKCNSKGVYIDYNELLGTNVYGA